MIQVTETAIRQIRKELKDMDEEIDTPHIRLHMAVG